MVCSVCKKKKLLNRENFRLNSRNKNGFDYLCKLCRKLKDKVIENKPETKAIRHNYRINNREKVNALNRKSWNRNNRDKIYYARLRNRWHIKNAYGLTEKNFTDLMRSQKSRCAICKRLFSVLRKTYKNPVHIDHNHKTGKVRGLLCNKCNWMLGNAGENVKTLEFAIAYIKNN